MKRAACLSDEKADRIQGMLVDAMFKLESLEIRYGCTAPPSLKTLTAIECSVNGWVRNTLRDLGVKLGKRARVLRVDLTRSRHIDDGENDILINLDFGEILPKLFGTSREELAAALAAAEAPEATP